MEDLTPRVIKNREFVGLEEEDIQRLNRDEARKFEQNPEFRKVSDRIEAEMEKPWRCDEHWLTVDDSGKRIYARIYSNDDRSLAVSSDGRIIKEMIFAERGTEKAH